METLIIGIIIVAAIVLGVWYLRRPCPAAGVPIAAAIDTATVVTGTTTKPVITVEPVEIRILRDARIWVRATSRPDGTRNLDPSEMVRITSATITPGSSPASGELVWTTGSAISPSAGLVNDEDRKRMANFEIGSSRPPVTMKWVVKTGGVELSANGESLMVTVIPATEKSAPVFSFSPSSGPGAGRLIEFEAR